ncbi:A24 family peptidase [Micromonospora sp. NPDC023737]|uniref:A24 family peptidase n=1 Tax=unclassified Micromonospora TaxID=2617518 RepID=UPI0033CD6217
MSAGPLTVVVLLGVLAGSAAPALAGRFLAPGTRAVRRGLVVPGTRAVRRGLLVPGTRAVRPGLLVPGSQWARPGLAVAGGVVFGGLAAVHGDDPALPVFLLIAAVGLALSVVDLACLRLPDPLVGTTAAAGTLGLVTVAAAGGELLRLPMAAAGAAVSLTVGLLLALLPGSRLGFGDVKLATALGLPLGWLGWPALAWGLALPHVLGGSWALALLAAGRVRRDTALPFGPAILAGAWLAALIA